jgi:hypothetical protein
VVPAVEEPELGEGLVNDNDRMPYDKNFSLHSILAMTLVRFK